MRNYMGNSPGTKETGGKEDSYIVASASQKTKREKHREICDIIRGDVCGINMGDIGVIADRPSRRNRGKSVVNRRVGRPRTIQREYRIWRAANKPHGISRNIEPRIGVHGYAKVAGRAVKLEDAKRQVVGIQAKR